MPVKLKFRVQSVERFLGWQGKELSKVRLSPVSDGSDENKAFYDATPQGQIEFATINKAAADSLPLGGDVYVTIEPAPAQS